MSVQTIPLFALAVSAETPTESGVPLELPENVASQDETAPAEAILSESANQYAVYSFNETTQKLAKTLCAIPSGATTLTNETAWGSAFYVASGEVDLNVVTVTGDAALVLTDDCDLTVNGGISVSEGSSLAIFAEQGGTGTLTATGTEGLAGIGGGGNITIHGGIINATGGSEEGLFGGAGIGGSGHLLNLNDDYEYAETEEIVFINPGAAGTVCIYGGTVTAIGGYHSAGIGGGGGCDGGNISIYGGNITATGQDGAPGIGCGMADCLDMTWDTVTVPVNGGTVTIENADVVSNGEAIAHKHDYTSGIYKVNEDGTHSRKCTKCDRYSDAEAHIFDGDYVDNGDGTHARKCTFCEGLDTPEAHSYVRENNTTE